MPWCLWVATPCYFQSHGIQDLVVTSVYIYSNFIYLNNRLESRASKSAEWKQNLIINSGVFFMRKTI